MEAGRLVLQIMCLVAYDNAEMEVLHHQSYQIYIAIHIAVIHGLVYGLFDLDQQCSTTDDRTVGGVFVIVESELLSLLFCYIMKLYGYFLAESPAKDGI